MNTYNSARQMLDDLGNRRISARELLEAHVARNQEVHARINAVIETDLDAARKAADAIDTARSNGETLGPLAGLPMTIKDGIDVQNMPASSGNPALKDRPKDCADAVVVDAVRKAGAVIWGKTNVPLMLGDMQSYNAIYGTTNNPYDTRLSPGGSSGGAGAALATGVTPLEIGSDIGGSVRHPANYCGVCALKPTWGVLDLHGHVPPLPGRFFETDLGVLGPMARNIGDLELLWRVLSERPRKSTRAVKDMRIAVWDQEKSFPQEKTVTAAVLRAANALRDAGARIENTKPDIDGAALMQCYQPILTATLSVSLPDHVWNDFASRRDADRKIAANDAGATYRLRATASFREVAGAMIERDAMKEKLKAFFDSGYDAILMPLGTVTPFPHNQEGTPATRMLDVDGVKVPYISILNWIALGSALHVPALAVPAGMSERNVPVGVQLVTRWNAEDLLFDLGAEVENRLGGFTPPPI